MNRMMEESEKLRTLLSEVIACQSAHYGDGCGLHLSMITLAGRIKDALSQQAEPKCSTCNDVGIIGHSDICPECADTWKQQAEPAPAQDEREAFEAEARKLLYVLDREAISGEYIVPDTENAWQLWRARSTRPAQTEQQPIQLSDDVREYLQEGINTATQGEECDDDYEFANGLARLLDPIYAAPIAQTAMQGTTSDKYRAELYDEVWEKARSMGYGNVTDALIELERMKTAPQPEQSGLAEIIKLAAPLIELLYSEKRIRGDGNPPGATIAKCEAVLDKIASLSAQGTKP